MSETDQEQPAPPQDPIVTYEQTFELGADPQALHDAASAVRGLGQRALDAYEIVKSAADEVESEGAWRGETADNYQVHRRTVSTDLQWLGSESTGAADTLDEIADLLYFYQEALRGERAALDGIRTTQSRGMPLPDDLGGPMVTFHPATAAEAAAVSGALARAGELRSELNDDLALKETALRRRVDGSPIPVPPGYANPGLGMLAETWQPRLRHLNLNIGEGDPTDRGDMDDIAGIINGEDANVVTLQEVYREDLGTLQEHLDGEWEIYFATASTKFRGGSPENWNEDFGNAVLVRQGGGVESQAIEEDNSVKLDPPGGWYPGGADFPVPDIDAEELTTETVSEDEVPEEEYRPDGEGRAAAVAQITINP